MISERALKASDVGHFDLLPFIALMMIVLATLLFINMTLAAINIGAGAAEGWIPTIVPGEEHKEPVLVEWDGETVIIQTAKQPRQIHIGKQLQQWWNSDWTFKNQELGEFLEQMSRTAKTRYVLFAVRPSGFENFQTLAAEFRNKGVSVGYEPVEQDKRIRLKLHK